MDTLTAMLAQRPILEQAGVSFEPITNNETIWAIALEAKDPGTPRSTGSDR